MPPKQEASDFDVEMVAQAADSLLREHPEALVCGLAGDGLIVPIPASVALWGQAAIEGRAVIDGVVSDDRGAVISTWWQAKREGQGEATVRLLSEPTRPMRLHFLDLRAKHEVVLCVIVPSNEKIEQRSPSARASKPTGPRFSTLTEDESGVILACDEAFTRMFGYTSEELVGSGGLEQIHPKDQARVVEGWLTMLSSRRVQQTRLRRRRSDGTWLWVDTTLHNFLNQPDRNHVLIELIDVSAEMAAQEALEEQSALLRRLIEAMPDGMLQLDTELNVVYHNARLLEILRGEPARGSTSAKPGGPGDGAQDAAEKRPVRTLLDTVTEDSMDALEAALTHVLHNAVDRDIEVDVELPSGAWRRALMSIRVLVRSSGEVSGAIASVLDVTDRARAHQELEKRATFDALTNAHNRSSILAELGNELEHEDASRNTGILYIDMDHFKLINDTHGHTAGDEVLTWVVERIGTVKRADDEVGRLGGDEFLVLLRGIPGDDVAMSVAGRLSESLRTSVELSCGTVELSASIGVACTNGASVSAEELISRADAAMYRCKAARKNQPVLATEEPDPLSSPVESHSASTYPAHA
jgi:diguanylate cyclase (GGDEF)-like protein/PAS domain S-box-containing protein